MSLALVRPMRLFLVLSFLRSTASMCVSPIQITRPFGRGYKTFAVPCGKCEECLKKRHSDFAALAMLEARACSSMYFVTLTYDNDSVPVMRSRVRFHNNCSEGFFTEVLNFDFVPPASKMRALCVRAMSLNMDGSKRLSDVSITRRYAAEDDGDFSLTYYTPSLRRLDVRSWLKRFRLRWLRETGESPSFRYVFFGEYGSATLRPHYHGLLFDVSESQVRSLRSAWEKEFGFTSFKFVPLVNSDGSPARLKVAQYVSKYVAKGLKDYEAVSLGLVERPRRFSSVGFGTSCLSDAEVSHLKNFIDAKI